MISIVIPAHNERSYLKRLLAYLESEAIIPETEILVSLSMDTCDGSAALSGAKNVQFNRCEKKGRAVQMNNGADRAKGDVLVFLHADVLPPKGFLDNIRHTLCNGYDAGFFSYKFDKENFFLKVNASFTGKDSIFTGGGDQCLFIRRETFNMLGRFDETQVLMEDFEFFRRMKKRKIPYKIIKNDLIVSARKYEHNSYARVNLANLLLVILFKLGYPATKLKSLHNRLIRIPRESSS